MVKLQFTINFAWTFSNSVLTLHYCVQQFALLLEESIGTVQWRIQNLLYSKIFDHAHKYYLTTPLIVNEHTTERSEMESSVR